MSRTRQLLYIGFTLIGAVFVLIYRGPLWPFVRSYMGDWLVVQFIYLIARFWIGYRWRYWLAIAILLFSLLVEVIQFVAGASFPQTATFDWTIGHTFDPVDIAAYTLGLATILMVEHIWNTSRDAKEPIG